MKLSKRFSGALAALAVTGSIVATVPMTSAQVVVEPPLIGDLQGVPVPMPDLTGFVPNTPAAQAALLQLGKAFFWDLQLGSDGNACASCHFGAGADTRTVNQLHPGFTDKRFAGGDLAYGGLTSEPSGFTNTIDLSPPGTAGKTLSGATARSNMSLDPVADFPFHKLTDPEDPNSAILYTTNDVASSQGTFGGAFISVVPGSANDNCAMPSGAVFHNLHGTVTRAVEPRNTPTVINAIFLLRNFWDGRANMVFNGENPFGLRDPNAFVVEAVTVGRVTTATKRQIALAPASLASQAVGPGLSDLEMSCAGRIWPQVGKKMLSVYPLALQQVHVSDSLLAPVRQEDGTGLTKTYRQLIQAAFDSRWWRAAGKYRRNNGNLVVDNSAAGFSQMELNFSMFWGIALLKYQSTLVSDQTPFDLHDRGVAPFAADSPEARGLAVFTSLEAQCFACHNGPDFTTAGILSQAGNDAGDPLAEGLVERMLLADGLVNPVPANYDLGFYNIGVTPTVADVGLGGTDPFGNPLSFTRQLLNGTIIDPFNVNFCNVEVPPIPVDPNGVCDPAAQLAALLANAANERQDIDGAFKTPGLRNVALNAPYFHNGGYATLDSVVEFYDRGGNRRGDDLNNTTGTGPLGKSNPVTNQRVGTNLAPEIGQLLLTPQQQSDLVAFLKSLTDPRVACHTAPFDHPSLPLFDGHDDADLTNPATDFTTVLPATGGAIGLATCVPNTGDLASYAGVPN